MRGIIHTVGCLVQRGVLPNLRRLSLGRARVTWGHLPPEASAASNSRAVRSTPCLALAESAAGEYNRINTGVWGCS